MLAFEGKPMSHRHDLARQLLNHAQGLHAATAAIELLCAHHAWLGKPAFVSRYAIIGTGTSGEPYACINWSEAIAALDAGHIHGSGSENNILRIAASIGDTGVPVQLACVLGNLDRTNIGLVTAAIVRPNDGGTGPASTRVKSGAGRIAMNVSAVTVMTDVILTAPGKLPNPGAGVTACRQASCRLLAGTMTRR
jgi:hypothetical protein